MELFVHKYLSRHYEIKTSVAGNDGIYAKEDTRSLKAPYNGFKLLNELASIFGITKEISKGYVIKWTIGIKPDIDLDFYWMPYGEMIHAPYVPLQLLPIYNDFNPSILNNSRYSLGIDPACFSSFTITIDGIGPSIID